MKTDVMQTKAKTLGAFLKVRREQITPADVGLPAGIRRRAVGLRREEVAILAGLSATWYTWLEQGRNIQVSSQVLASICKVLRLNQGELEHVFQLADLPLTNQSMQASPDIPPNISLLLHELSFPAFVTDYKMNMVMYNYMTRLVYIDFKTLPKDDQNTLRFMFTNPVSKQILPDWEKQAATAVATFRSLTSRYVEEAWFKDQITYLSKRSKEFATYWDMQTISATHETTKHIKHPLVGSITLATTNFAVQGSPGLTLTIQTPLDGVSTERLAELHQCSPDLVNTDSRSSIHN